MNTNRIMFKFDTTLVGKIQRANNHNGLIIYSVMFMNGVVEPIDYKLSQDTDRPYKEEDVFKKKKYDYFNVKIFGKKNEHAEMFQKGDLVEFFGHIKTTVYINKDGVKTKEYYLKATSQKLIETQDQYDNPRAYAQKLNNKQPEKHQYFKSIQPENAEIIEDDDIPF